MAVTEILCGDLTIGDCPAWVAGVVFSKFLILLENADSEDNWREVQEWLSNFYLLRYMQ